MEKTIDILDQYSTLTQNNNAHGRKFHRLSRAVHHLDKSKPDAKRLSVLFERFERKKEGAKSDQMFAEYTLLCGHLGWLGSLYRDPELTRHYQEFSLKNPQDGLLSRSEETLQDENTATFFLPAHEMCVSEGNIASNGFRRDLFEERSKEQFFPRILKVLAKVWPTIHTAVNPRSLDAKLMLRNSFIQFMHKQLLQNVLTHAYANATFNSNFNRFYLDHYSSAGPDFLFGSLAYLDIQILDPGKVAQNTFSDELASIHLSLEGNDGIQYERLVEKKARILTFSYCDTGPGIERHLRHFSPKKSSLPKSFDAKYVLDNELAGRSISGAGKGLSDVRQLAIEAGATLIIETPDSTYLHVPSEKEGRSCNSSRVQRGTSVTLLFEI